MRHVSREKKGMRNRDGSVSKWLKITITCLFTETAHFLLNTKTLLAGDKKLETIYDLDGELLKKIILRINM